MHQGINPDKETGAILTPIVQSTTFIQDSVEEYLVRPRQDSTPTAFVLVGGELWRLCPARDAVLSWKLVKRCSVLRKPK